MQSILRIVTFLALRALKLILLSPFIEGSLIQLSLLWNRVLKLNFVSDSDNDCLNDILKKSSLLDIDAIATRVELGSTVKDVH